jgi:hypothetical protein
LLIHDIEGYFSTAYAKSPLQHKRPPATYGGGSLVKAYRFPFFLAAGFRFAVAFFFGAAFFFFAGILFLSVQLALSKRKKLFLKHSSIFSHYG